MVTATTAFKEGVIDEGTHQTTVSSGVRVRLRQDRNAFKEGVIVAGTYQTMTSSAVCVRLRQDRKSHNRYMILLIESQHCVPVNN